MKQVSLLREFDVLVADPPWKPDDSLGDRGAEANYDTMSTKEICDMEIPPMGRDAFLFMWRLSSMLEDALLVGRAWGFTQKSELVWNKLTKHGKPWFGMGRTVRNAHETCLIFTRGKAKVHDKSIRSTFSAKVPVGFTGEFNKKGEPKTKYIHSAKPDEFYAIIRKLTGPGLKRVEMFGRRQRKGWVVLGNQATKYPEVV